MVFTRLSWRRQNKSLTATITSSLALATTLGLLQTFTATAFAEVPTLTTLVNFNGDNGANPCAGLIADANGNLYGTTGVGTLYELAAGTHALTTLTYNLGSTATTLRADAEGNLYGTTWYGGAAGIGRIFKFDFVTHEANTLASFTGPNGSTPWPGLAADSTGHLYGTTQKGGAADRGTVFELNPETHNLTALVSFDGSNGAEPIGGILVDPAGNLYGTANWGGANNNGTLYKITAETHEFIPLASFDFLVTGSFPNGLIMDGAGNLYGTAGAGGSGGYGTIFEFLVETQELVPLASFNGTNGVQSMSPLLMDAAGNLFGTTIGGGANNEGTVFMLAAGSHEITTLVNFNGINGSTPYTGGLCADANGTLYGTTQYGGINNLGTVFMLTNPGFVVAPEPATLTLFAPTLLLFMKRRKP